MALFLFVVVLIILNAILWKYFDYDGDMIMIFLLLSSLLIFIFLAVFSDGHYKKMYKKYLLPDWNPTETIKLVEIEDTDKYVIDLGGNTYYIKKGKEYIFEEVNSEKCEIIKEKTEEPYLIIYKKNLISEDCPIEEMRRFSYPFNPDNINYETKYEFHVAE